MSKSREVILQLENTITNNLGYTVLYGLAVVLSVVLSILASRYPYFPGDVTIAHLIQSISFEPFDALMRGLTAMGLYGLAQVIPSVSAIVLIVAHRKLEGIFTFLTLSAEVINLAIKEVVRRPRPSSSLVDIRWPAEESSFPSGHVMYFVVFFGFLFFLTWTEMKPSPLRTAALCVLGLLIALIGVSRVYLGAHWPSDVAGAYLIGALWLVGLITVYSAVKAPVRANRS